ncbi:MAG: hypothetical protein AAGG59_17970 [Bacteroidota bacterium]
MMKKHLLILCQVVVLISALFILESCGDDDEDGPSGLPLEGTLWTQISFEYTDCDSPDDNESGTLVCTDQDCITVLFENGTATYTEIEDGVTFEISIPVTITANTFSALGETASYQIIGNTLTVVSEDSFDGCTLTEVYVGPN